LLPRPSVPQEVKREVLFEARNRCAVCCHALSLEIAHIIPWRKTQDHSIPNLIALCPNCHSQADSEGWGAKYLKKYKEKPCAIESKRLPNVSPLKMAAIDLIISTDPEYLDEKEKKRFLYALSAFLDIDVSLIEIKSIEKANSSRIKLSMPLISAESLIKSFEESDPDLEKMIYSQKILKIEALEFDGDKEFPIDSHAVNDRHNHNLILRIGKRLFSKVIFSSIFVAIYIIMIRDAEHKMSSSYNYVVNFSFYIYIAIFVAISVLSIIVFFVRDNIGYLNKISRNSVSFNYSYTIIYVEYLIDNIFLSVVFSYLFILNFVALYYNYNLIFALYFYLKNVIIYIYSSILYYIIYIYDYVERILV